MEDLYHQNSDLHHSTLYKPVMLTFYGALVQYYSFPAYVIHSCYFGTICFLLKFLRIKALFPSKLFYILRTADFLGNHAVTDFLYVIKIHIQRAMLNLYPELFGDEENNERVQQFISISNMQVFES